VGLNKSYRKFAAQFAEAVIAKDFTTAHQMLAPWLRRSVTPQQLSRIIKEKVNEIAEANELGGDLHPGSYQIDWNISTLEDLRTPPSYGDERSIPAEVTDKNFRQWMVIQFQPKEEEELEIDAYLDWWMMVVEEGGEQKIGYYEIDYPD
jgi:hypothetical protein